MNRASILIIGGTVLLSANFVTAQTAQTTSPEAALMAYQSPSQDERLRRFPAPAPDYETSVLLREAILYSMEVVKNAPYTATAVTESTITLADGNRVVNKRTSLVSRDGRGWRRREETLGEIGLLPLKGTHIILISDPTTGTDFILFPERKTVQQLKHNEEFNVRLKEEKPKYLGTVKEESLGTQVIEGISCEGTRLVQHIPAGTMGNEREMVLTSETWTSRDLHLLVLRKRKNPLSGETVYRLTNINRTEPDPSLFQVPADYKMEALPAGGPRHEKE